jgi:hypothetical protein
MYHIFLLVLKTKGNKIVGEPFKYIWKITVTFRLLPFNLG